MKDHDLEDAVISLHDIARLIETKIGRGMLAEDLKQAANTLASMLRYYIPFNKDNNE